MSAQSGKMQERRQSTTSDAQVAQHRGDAVGDLGDLGVRGFESFDG
jgi:hypothetical protein